MKNKIYQILMAQNLTQAELAGRVGVKREYLNKIINDKITPLVPLGLKIAQALGVQIEDIFGG